jgi:uncharacterized membrane protein YhfC
MFEFLPFLDKVVFTSLLLYFLLLAAVFFDAYRRQHFGQGRVFLRLIRRITAASAAPRCFTLEAATIPAALIAVTSAAAFVVVTVAAFGRFE